MLFLVYFHFLAWQLNNKNSSLRSMKNMVVLSVPFGPFVFYEIFCFCNYFEFFASSLFFYFPFQSFHLIFLFKQSPFQKFPSFPVFFPVKNQKFVVFVFQKNYYKNIFSVFAFHSANLQFFLCSNINAAHSLFFQFFSQFNIIRCNYSILICKRKNCCISAFTCLQNFYFSQIHNH